MITAEEIAFLVKLRSIGYNDYNPMSWFTGQPKIGKDVWIGAFCLIDGLGGLTIGDECNISSGAQIVTHSTVPACLYGRERGEMELSPTIIGKRVFVGANATILRGCTIGDQCVIGAGSVVLEHTDIPSQCVVAGNPVRFIRRLSPMQILKRNLITCGCEVKDVGDLSYFNLICEEHL